MGGGESEKIETHPFVLSLTVLQVRLGSGQELQKPFTKVPKLTLVETNDVHHALSFDDLTPACLVQCPFSSENFLSGCPARKTGFFQQQRTRARVVPWFRR